jgi:IclR family KDG regulon transcriptional repressor
MKENPVLISSIQKALQVMEALDEKGSMGTREIATTLKMGKSTVHRILVTLKHEGWVVENPSTKKNQLSYKLFSIGSNLVKQMESRKIIKHYMEKLAEETGESVNLGVLFEGMVVHIDKIESRASVKVDATIGAATTSYNTALGKALLAEKTDEEVIEFFSDKSFMKTAKNTITSLDILLLELDKVRKEGFALDNEEYANGMICMAVSLGVIEGNVHYALSVAFPAFRYEKNPDKLNNIANLLIQTKNKVANLAYSK